MYLWKPENVYIFCTIKRNTKMTKRSGRQGPFSSRDEHKCTTISHVNCLQTQNNEQIDCQRLPLLSSMLCERISHELEKPSNSGKIVSGCPNWFFQQTLYVSVHPTHTKDNAFSTSCLFWESDASLGEHLKNPSSVCDLFPFDFWRYTTRRCCSLPCALRKVPSAIITLSHDVKVMKAAFLPNVQADQTWTLPLWRYLYIVEISAFVILLNLPIVRKFPVCSPRRQFSFGAQRRSSFPAPITRDSVVVLSRLALGTCLFVSCLGCLNTK